MSYFSEYASNFPKNAKDIIMKYIGLGGKTIRLINSLFMDYNYTRSNNYANSKRSGMPHVVVKVSFKEELKPQKITHSPGHVK